MMPLPQKMYLEVDGVGHQLEPFKHYSAEHFYVVWQKEVLDKKMVIRAQIHPKKEVTLNAVSLDFSYSYKPDYQVFCNGYQSWSPSYLIDLKTQPKPPMRSWAKRFMGHHSDYYFRQYSQQAGVCQSWTYTYIKTGLNAQKEVFAGSFSDDSGFVLWEHNLHRQSLKAIKDLDNQLIGHSFPLFDLLISSEGLSASLDDYFAYMANDRMGMRFPQKQAQRLWGWTSWYRYFDKINQQVLDKNIELCSTKLLPHAQDLPFVFQIDDGWQTQIGDWSRVDSKKFPNGLEPVIASIKSNKMLAGLWFAPFVASAKSELFANNPSWFVKDDKGNPLKIGYNLGWGGWFYALNFYNKAVKDYLTQVVAQMKHQWGIQFLKLDFLYAAAINPPKDKNRGQAMHEAMEFLQSIIGPEIKTLGCGVPLAAAFGRVDYCRIGQDVNAHFDHALLRFLNFGERPSVALSLENTLLRQHLDGRAFGNDPDVFFLRNKACSLTPDWKTTLLLANTLAGSLVFCSDPCDELPEEALARWQVLPQLLAEYKNTSTTLKNRVFFELSSNIQNKSVTFKGNLSSGGIY